MGTHPPVADKGFFSVHLHNAYGGWLLISSVTGHELMSKALENLQMTNHPMQELFAFGGVSRLC